MPVPQTQYARSGGVHIAYQVIGDGPRDIVLVLDWGSHLEAFWEHPLLPEFVLSLTRFARVLAFDMRGVGLSDRDIGAVPTEEWMEDVGAVMDAAGSERATIVAHGHASQMALLFAATHPDRVDSLVLINGYARLSRAEDYPFGVPPQVAQAMLDSVELEWGTGDSVRILGPSVAELPGVRESWARIQRYAASPGTAVAKMRTSLELDVRNALPLIDVPTLVIVNRDDRLVRADHGRYLAENVARARLFERDSADHWPWRELAPESVSLIV